jgi:hypothetical protein
MNNFQDDTVEADDWPKWILAVSVAIGWLILVGMLWE